MRTLKMRWRVIPAVGCTLLALGLLYFGGAIAADPGSKDDPLATVAYVRGHAQFVAYDLSPDTSVRLGPGAEFVVISPATGLLPVSELQLLSDTVIDLSSGEALRLLELTPNHHYLNASQHDIFLRPAADAQLMVRGEFK